MAQSLSEALKSKAILLQTIDPQSSLDDLLPLKAILKDVRIVGMGEATHGTADFFKMKHRMLRFLVEEMGFRLFGMESTFGETMKTNEYVLHGRGTALDALRAISGNGWQNREILELIEWMRCYNEGKAETEKVKFYGFDLIYSRGSALELINYFKRTAPGFVPVAESLFADFTADKLHRRGVEFTPAEIDRWTRQLNQVAAYMAVNADDLIAKSSSREYKLMQKHTDVLAKVIEISGLPDREETRDRYMAENICWLLDYEGGRMMIWAHNLHVCKSTEVFKATGWHLDQMYGREYYAAGFEFNRGGVLAPAPHEAPRERLLPAAGTGTLGHVCAQTGLPLFFLDVEQALQEEQLQNWLMSKTKTHAIGVFFMDEVKSFVECTVAKNYSGLIFIENVTAAKAAE